MKSLAKYSKSAYESERIENAKIILHERIDITPHFRCVSLRALRVPNIEGKKATNRRFYVERSKPENGRSCWSISKVAALELIRRADQAHCFDEENAGVGSIESVDTAIPGKADYSKLIGQALVKGDFENDWENSIAIICNQEDGNWRKIMLFNPKTQKVTFRSLTSDSTYKLAAKKLAVRDDSNWYLDRAMLDAHPAAFKHWLKYLESIQK